MELAFNLGVGPSKETIDFIEKILRVSFPVSFRDFISMGDRFRTKRYISSYFDPVLSKKDNVSIGSTISFNPGLKNNIVRFYFTMPNFFPNKLIPIIEVGNGDLICFDYSVSGFEDKDPPIVLWIHDYEEGKNIIDLAINFETFLNNLKSEEEIEAMKI